MKLICLVEVFRGLLLASLSCIDGLHYTSSQRRTSVGASTFPILGF